MTGRVDQGAESCRRWYSERTADSELGWLKTYLEPGLDVLDVGCGPGTVTMDVARLVAPGQVIGIDVAEASVAEATERAREANIDNVRYEVGDALELRFPDRSFDLAYSANVLPFLEDPVRALSEQKRVTKRNGWVAAQTDDRIGSLLHPPCPHVEKFFSALSAVSDPSTDCFVADYAFARKAYGYICRSRISDARTGTYASATCMGLRGSASDQHVPFARTNWWMGDFVHEIAFDRGYQ